MTLVSSSRARHDAPMSLSDWEGLLPPRERQRLDDLRQAGATLSWRRKDLESGDGQAIVHYVAIVHAAGGRQVLGQAGPMDTRYQDRTQLVIRLARSALGQAWAITHPN